MSSISNFHWAKFKAHTIVCGRIKIISANGQKNSTPINIIYNYYDYYCRPSIIIIYYARNEPARKNDVLFRRIRKLLAIYCFYYRHGKYSHDLFFIEWFMLLDFIWKIPVDCDSGVPDLAAMKTNTCNPQIYVYTYIILF